MQRKKLISIEFLQAANAQPSSPLTSSGLDPVVPSLSVAPPPRWANFPPAQRYCQHRTIGLRQCNNRLHSFPRAYSLSIIDPFSLKVLQNVMEIVLEFSTLRYLFFISLLATLKRIKLNRIP